MSARTRQRGGCVAPRSRGWLCVPLLATLLVLGSPQRARGRSHVDYEDEAVARQAHVVSPQALSSDDDLAPWTVEVLPLKYPPGYLPTTQSDADEFQAWIEAEGRPSNSQHRQRDDLVIADEWLDRPGLAAPHRLLPPLSKQQSWAFFTRRLLQGPFLGCPRGKQRCPSGIPECMSAAGSLYEYPYTLGEDGRCNGKVECSDGSDEAAELCQGGCTCPVCYKCPYPACHAKCPSGTCTNTTVTGYSPASDQDQLRGATPWLCNGKPDCADGSDEDPTFCKSYDCSKSVAKGPYLYNMEYTSCPGGAGYCVVKSNLCNGQLDCPDGSDEDPAFCGTLNCQEAGGRTKCPGGVGCVYGEPAFCDGFKNCPDGSDEDVAFCKDRECPQGKTKCPSGGDCIYSYGLCNGFKDCLDGSDEDLDYCRNVYQCPPTATRCPGGAGCYSNKNQLCDSKADCPDGSDEDPAFCASFPCTDGYDPTRNYPKCPSGVGCLRYGGVCNALKDCLDNSDEESCSAANCTSTPDEPRIWCAKEKACFGGRLCDGVSTCSDGSDESPAACASIDSCPSTGSNPPLQRCPDKSACIKADRFCDGFRDCVDGSDEQPGSCKDVKCSDTGRETCPSGVGCLKSKNQICDGIANCIDSSDEQDCTADKCGADPNSARVFCPTAKKCAFGFYCDSVNDCPDGSDEDSGFCSKQSCPNKYGTQYVKCPGGGSCVAPTALCNGRKECPDGSDESEAACRDFDCSASNKVKCPGGVACVNEFQICDSRPDCGNGTDEDPAFCASYDCSKSGRGKCPGNKQCLYGDAKYALCNGYADCTDKSDEDAAFCASLDCAAYGRGTCPSGKGCLPGYSSTDPAGALCNGYRDCPDGSDEDPTFCKGYTCQATPFGVPRVKCPGNGTQCVNGDLLCNGYPGTCKDGSDNTPETCADVDCAQLAGQDTIKCPGRALCVHGRLCDGVSHCPNAEDEDPALCKGDTSGGVPPAASPPGSGNPNPGEPPANPPTALPPATSSPGPAPDAPAATSAPPTESAGGATTTVPASTACPAVDGILSNSCFNREGTVHVCCVSPDFCGSFTPSGDATCANGKYVIFEAPPAGPPDPPPPTFALVAAGVACPVCRGAPSNSCFNPDGSGHVCCVSPDTCSNTGPSCTNGNAVQFTGSFAGPVTATNC